MASTYVEVTSLEDAHKYFDAGAAYWWSEVRETWVPQAKVSDNSFPPQVHEVTSGWWGILVEEEDDV